MSDKILHLTLKKKWFDLIASGKKKFEYREIKPYWEKRLFDEHGLRYYDYIIFRNGYRKDSPKLFVEYKAFSIKTFEGKNHYALHLGKIIKTLNINNKNNGGKLT